MEDSLSQTVEREQVTSQQQNLNQESNLTASAPSLPSTSTSLISRRLDDSEVQTDASFSENGLSKHQQNRFPSPQECDDMDPNNLPSIPPELLLSDPRNHHSPTPASPDFSDILASSTQKDAGSQEHQSSAPAVSSFTKSFDVIVPQDRDDDEQSQEDVGAADESLLNASQSSSTAADFWSQSSEPARGQPASKRRMVISHNKYIALRSLIVLHLSEAERETGRGIDRDTLIDWYLKSKEEDIEYEKRLITKMLKRLVKDDYLIEVRGDIEDSLTESKGNVRIYYMVHPSLDTEEFSEFAEPGSR